VAFFQNGKIQRSVRWLSCGFLIAILGCDTGEIQNFAAIQIESDFRIDRLKLRIFLLDRNRRSLILSESILTPQIGLSLVSESEFITNAKIYSMRQGVKSAKVYDARLRNLRWGGISGTHARVLFAEIPLPLISQDPQRDTEIGIITITVETDKQGPFSDTLENTRVYRTAP
jgi:hypothetical protein